MAEDTISLIEAANIAASLTSKKDKNYESIMEDITERTNILLEDNAHMQNKFDAVVSVEYLLVKLRLDVEFEHISVKRLLNDKETPAALRGHFMKRDQYLAQLSLKLNSIRDDISALQKLVYVQSTRKIN